MRVLRLSVIMGILAVRRTLATETRQVDRFFESVPCKLQKTVCARRIPAAVRRVGAELALDLFARERLIHAAADMRLTVLEYTPVPQCHFYVAGVSLRIRIVRIDDVAHLGSERENARIAHGFFGERLEPGATCDKRDRDIEGRAEFGGVFVRGAMFG